MLGKILIATRSLNKELYDLCKSLLEHSNIHMVQLTGTSDVGYLQSICFNYPEYDWVINIDEDCFIWDIRKLLGLLAYMIANDYHVCGVPDGGVVHHRFHNPIIPNPFFNIFNARKIRDVGIYNIPYDEKFEKYSPIKLFKPGFKYEYDNFETYYGFFFGLLDKGLKFLYLDASEWELDNNISTIVKDAHGGPFAIHTWFARNFHTTHHDRIMNAYKYAIDRRITILKPNNPLYSKIRDLDVQHEHLNNIPVNVTELILTFDPGYIVSSLEDKGVSTLCKLRDVLRETLTLLDLQIERKRLLEE